MENKRFQHIFLDKDKPATYADIIRFVLKSQPTGKTYEEIDRYLRIAEACKNAEKTIEISEEDRRYVAEAAKAHRWNIAALPDEAVQEIKQFVESFL